MIILPKLLLLQEALYISINTASVSLMYLKIYLFPLSYNTILNLKQALKQNLKLY